jgi:hypothetical protein
MRGTAKPHQRVALTNLAGATGASDDHNTVIERAVAEAAPLAAVQGGYHPERE